MELRHLKYFVAVAEDLNFSRAAVRLYISQPALSRQIKDLENELSVMLFLRQSDGLKLTEAGKFFLEQAKDILNRSYVSVQTIKANYTNQDQPLVIGYIPTILQSFLGQTLQSFGLAYPQVAVSFREMSPSEQVKALRDGGINIAFMGNPPDNLEEEFMVKCIKKVPIIALLSNQHPLANQASINLAELASEKFIGMSEETFPGRNDRIHDVCRCAGFIPNLHLFADSHASMIALVATGQGVAIMPSEAEALPHPQTVFVKLNHPLYYSRSTAVWRKETPAKYLDKFLTILLNYVE
ncbi:LysR family transcriptional regulator [Planktothrix paucivesiculata]|uniref:Helix-turn-helix transcriptional regulator, LysR family n=1 Tax=Planktothrix paucivesiculata PCC 9631 TaxID=671071 RepID=A0A7Z9BPW1_9CYAN|nr:LysR substrate-binding domain-containing protein [Planktothrix paucivesiculata]VXD17794.1 Helix-turn-helix transcriptional regulator, LysR family [Planktothrix paucivesiculata PCC 9631]